ncbi:AAA family ATPase [Streptomyces tanashiensis]|uniref:ATP-binding protein n=1 Tax=Streptomyces tanashiensis TaxID=67367 RepID=A0ABY6R7M2_9ACTN|nr:AAA family ATPase [Streptomyces tanashiensis]UZX26012.1 ATP-binding protein [Streptomyces tanashiensis]
MGVSEGAEDPSHSAAPGMMSTVHPPRVRLEAFAAGGRAMQAARDLYVSETHHHGRPAGPLAVVEPVLPTDEAAAEVFVGRSAETRDVLAVLDPTHGATGMVVASSVAGLAGIGKTALARSCAAEAVARGWYAGGAVFVDLDGYAPDPTDQVMPEHVFAPMLHALGHQGPLDASVAGQAAQYHRLLAERAAERRPVLLVLDNASSSAQIADLMPRSRMHRTLITSRHTLATRGSRTLELGTLTPVGARALVEEQLVFLSPDDNRTRLDVQGTERLCHLCGHLPLALHIATALLARDPDLTPGALADELARAQHRLDVLDDGERAVRAAFELSYRRLAPDQALLFRLMPLNPGPHIATDAAARLIDRAEDEAARLIRELARAHVVERAGTGVWRQHDLMRAYAIELLGRERDAQGEASNRLIEHYIAMAAAALSTLNTGTATASPAFRTAEEALAWCDREQSNLQAAISMAATFGDGDGALRIQEALIAVYAHRHQTAEWEAAARSAVLFAREAKDHPGRSRALHELMLALESAGRREEALAAAEDLLRFQYMIIMAALQAKRIGECRQLLEHARAAVAESQRLLGEDKRRFVHMRREDIARVANARGLDESFQEPGPRPARGLDEILQEYGAPLRADASTAPPGSPQAEAAAWARKALTRLPPARPQASDFDPVAADARKAAQRALALIPEDLAPEEAENWREVCELLARYAAKRLAGGATARSAGRFAEVPWTGRGLPQVATAYDIAVRAYERIGEPAAQARLLTDFARECFQSGDYTRAIRYQGQVADVAMAIGDEAGHGEALSAIAHAHLLLKNHEKAVRFAERALTLLTYANRPGAASRALTTVANARHGQNRHAEALSAALNAEALARSANDLPGHVAALLVLGLAQRATGSAEDASRSWRAALLTSRRVGDPYLTRETAAFLTSVGHPLT